MKKIWIILLILLITSFSLAKLMDKIVAKVGRDIILKSELEDRIQQMQAAGMIDEDHSKFEILNDMIETKVILQKAEKEGYVIDEFLIKDTADRQIKSVASQFNSEREFKQELEKAGLTVLELKEYYIEQLTEQSLREQIITNKIKNRINLTEAEVKDYYEENKDEIPLRPEMIKVGMIMRNIEPGDETKKELLVKINKIRDKLIQGEKFSDLAREYSDCPSANNGGDLGYFGKGTMVKSFEETAFALMPGEISEIVETTFGFHIIKVEEKKDDTVKASHILIKLKPTEEDILATVQLMENVLQKLRAGADFSEMAKTYSQDDSTAAKGGILGEFTPEEYPELFKKELQKIEIGEYSELIRESNVIYILGKLESIPERPYEYQEIYDQLKDLVRSEKEVELYNNWIKELIKENYVEILIDE